MAVAHAELSDWWRRRTAARSVAGINKERSVCRPMEHHPTRENERENDKGLGPIREFLGVLFVGPNVILKLVMDQHWYSTDVKLLPPTRI